LIETRPTAIRAYGYLTAFIYFGAQNKRPGISSNAEDLPQSMNAKSSYFKLGLFVLGAVLLGVAGILVLGAGALMRETIDLETYLDESVQGLSVGSPVKERGVQIGIVKEIDFARNSYALNSEEDPKNYGRYVVVKMSLPAQGKFQAIA
jgi:hypothetical protein